VRKTEVAALIAVICLDSIDRWTQCLIETMLDRTRQGRYQVGQNAAIVRKNTFRQFEREWAASRRPDPACHSIASFEQNIITIPSETTHV
jgi:hypothetical protein